jgi:hypothetical protein
MSAAVAMPTFAWAIVPGKVALAALRFVHDVAARSHHDDLGSAQPVCDKSRLGERERAATCPDAHRSDRAS